jgi:23S rRNA (pseudouridine1915-N3)-methyltransferase
MAFVITTCLRCYNKSIKACLFTTYLQQRNRTSLQTRFYALLHVSILSTGKIKERWLNMAVEEYVSRLKPFIAVELLWTRDNQHLLQLISKQTGSLYCLDAEGTAVDSLEFKTLLYQSFVKGKVNFVIGGPEGLPEKLKDQGKLLSLSPMTFTHQ